MFADPTTLILRIPALLIAVSVHEFMHAYVANRFGDPTAERQGRLTLNPISHLDPIGSLMIVLVGFGWAKPVPVNPMFFKDPRKGMMYVSLAGPLANFTAAFLAARLFLIPGIAGVEFIPQLLQVVIFINVALGIFNLVPIPPLDGSKVLAALLPEDAAYTYEQFSQYGFLVLILLLTIGRPIFWGIISPIFSFVLWMVTIGL